MSKKSGFVALLGFTNAGKSTLLNTILGQNISIVTPKPQTTRYKLFGIYSNDNTQIVFMDTPGFLKPKYKLHLFMKKEIDSSFVDADLLILIVDVSKYNYDDLQIFYQNYKNEFDNHKKFLVLNKIDLLTKESLLMTIDDANKRFSFDEIVPISALKAFNIDELLKTITMYLPNNEFYFSTENITTHPERFFASEIIRETIFNLFQDEIPFSVYVEINDFKERDKSRDYIKAIIYVEKESQKKIIIGKNGCMLKKIGINSRKEIEEFIGRELFIELHVKVKKNWRNDLNFLKRKFHSQYLL